MLPIDIFLVLYYEEIPSRVGNVESNTRVYLTYAWKTKAPEVGDVVDLLGSVYTVVDVENHVLGYGAILR